MKKIITIIISILFPLYAWAAMPVPNGPTDANITGHVVEAETGEHIPYVNIQIKGTSIGAVSDASGHFMLTNLPLGETTVVFSMVGYKTVEYGVILLEDKSIEIKISMREESELLDQVVVTANRYESKKREAVSIVSVISPLQFETTSSNSMADVLDFQTGLRVEMSCGNCGVPQLRINGLSGQYSQIMMDGRPIFSSLASVYGLEQVPAGMVDRVEVVRGGGSALYGSNAIGGVVNIITKEPVRNSLNLQNNTQLIGGKTWDVSTNLNGSFVTSDSKLGVFLFGVLRDRGAYDHDNDGFSEIPELKSSTLGMRSFFKTSTYSKLVAEYHYVTEKRRGGNKLDLPEHEADIAESLQHGIHAASLKWDYFSPDERHFLSTYASLQHIDRNSYFGTNQDLNAYGQSEDLTAVVGAQYRFHMYNCLFMPADLSAGFEYSYNNLRDQILGYNRDLRQQVHLYGGYVQNEWKNDVVSLNVGVRLEKHNLIKAPIASPRVNVRYTPIKPIVLRASYSTGYRAPQTYDEDLHVGAVGGEVSLISLDSDLRPEKSHSASLSVDWAQSFGKFDVTLLAEGFFTQLNNVFALVEQGYDDKGNLLLLRTNQKGARVGGINFETNMAYRKYFSLQLGYTYQQSRYIEPFKWSDDPDIVPQKRMFRTPDHYGFFTAKGTPVRNFDIILNGKLTGPMLLEHYAGYVPEDEQVLSPTFFDLGVKLAYTIPLYRLYDLEINAGVKNIFNSFQPDIDKGVNRDAGYIYGPALPRTYFFGLNFKL